MSASRVKSFADAVVAIALTLLILPLMDSVSEASHAEELTAQWWLGNQDLLFSFALSFVLIATFWVSHHWMFENVHRVSNPLLWLVVAWMFTIVWVPIATAVVGELHEDTWQKVLYIGSLTLTSVFGLLAQVYLHRHPDLHSSTAAAMRTATSSDLVTTALFLLAFVLAVGFPVLGYWPMLIMILGGPLQGVLRRRLRH
jgi:uncharacterized membrane protein